jgi:hypothetical protein
MLRPPVSPLSIRRPFRVKTWLFMLATAVALAIVHLLPHGVQPPDFFTLFMALVITIVAGYVNHAMHNRIEDAAKYAEGLGIEDALALSRSSEGYVPPDAAQVAMLEGKHIPSPREAKELRERAQVAANLVWNSLQATDKVSGKNVIVNIVDVIEPSLYELLVKDIRLRFLNHVLRDAFLAAFERGACQEFRGSRVQYGSDHARAVENDNLQTLLSGDSFRKPRASRYGDHELYLGLRLGD